MAAFCHIKTCDACATLPCRTCGFFFCGIHLATLTCCKECAAKTNPTEGDAA